jgi:hypothetical protein
MSTRKTFIAYGIKNLMTGKVNDDHFYTRRDAQERAHIRNEQAGRKTFAAVRLGEASLR